MSLSLSFADCSFDFRILEREEGGEFLFGELILCFYSLRSLGIRLSFSSFGTPPINSSERPTFRLLLASGIIDTRF